MSKTITIPSCKNPFVITVNNHTYSYKAGETVEVPDWVAEVIEHHVDSVPKPKRYLSRIAQLAEESLNEITEVDLAGISTISNCAFYSCKSLIKVTLPNAITKIGESAFDWCWSLESVYLPETPPTITKTNTFGNIKSTCVFYCKSQASLDAYRAAPNWSTVAGTYSFVVEE